MRVFVPAAAVLVCGAALYFSNSVLDQVVVNGQPLRIALVPDWRVLLAFVAMAALGLLWLSRRTAPRTVTSAPVRLRVATLALPAFAAALLIVPFMPLLPDAIPALQLPAGPLKGVVWLTTASLFGWTLWQVRIVRADWLQHLSVLQATLLVAALTATTAGLAAWCLARGVVFPGGDEPHYLVMAQSLWRDGDLKIENNHARGDYREYFGHDLKPDFLTRGADREIYSIHPVGMPVLMAPVYAIGGYAGVIVTLILFATLAAALMWRWVVETTNSPGAATFAWAAIVLTAPYLFNTFTVYPEILAASAVVVAFTRAVDADAWPRGPMRWWITGVCCAVLPWLSTKYAPMSLMLVLIALARSGATGATGATRATGAVRLPSPKALLGVLLPYALSLAAWFYFFYAIWGTPLPMAPYGGLVQTNPTNLAFGAPGLLFDQEYGVLAYAPVYILALTGLVAMWRVDAETRRRAIEIVVTFGALLGTVGAFRIWWGGTASPGRPLASALLLLMLPIAIAARRAPSGSARRAGHHLLLWVSVGVAITLAVAQEGLLINNGRDGTSSLLEYWSPRWSVWSAAPSFIFHEAPTAWLQALTWLALAWLAALLLSRWRTRTAGGAALVALTTFVGALLLASLLVPLVPHASGLPEANLSARSHLPVLDKFDSVARPVAVRYDAVTLQDASSIVPLAALVVGPGIRSDPQPLRVLHNGRFSLPAGRYHVEIEWAETTQRAVPIALQVGRIEPPWQTWVVQPERGSRWGADFELPADMSFVAFRGGTELERAIGHLAITPRAVIDESARPNVPIVLSVLQYGAITVLFHDQRASPEATGFWVLGRRDTRVTFARSTDQAPLALRVHSGLEPNRVTISMRDWAQTIDLKAEQPVEIIVPDSKRRLVTIDIDAEDGFSPQEHDPASEDPRLLGVWIEVVQ